MCGVWKDKLSSVIKGDVIHHLTINSVGDQKCHGFSDDLNRRFFRYAMLVLTTDVPYMMNLLASACCNLPVYCLTELKSATTH